MTESATPLPCPFCGGPPEVYRDHHFARIACFRCGCAYAQSRAGEEPDVAFERWDRRFASVSEPERTALLMLIKNLVQQGCQEKRGSYDSGFIGIYAEAMDILVNYGAAEYTDEYERPFYGRGRSVRFTNKLRDIWDVIRDANEKAKETNQ